MSTLLEIHFDRYCNQFESIQKPFAFVISHSHLILMIVFEYSFILTPKKNMCYKIASNFI
jgi:hypothetical protein